MSWAELSERTLEFFTLEYAFAARALATSVLVGVLCAVVGVFLVLRRLALVGDATAHATLPGVCIGFWLVQGKELWALSLGALASSLLAGAAINMFSKGVRVRSDAAIGIVLATFFGLGIVGLSYVQSSPSGAQAGLNSFLYGNAAAVSTQQLWTLATLALIVLFGIIASFRGLALTTFDPVFSSTVGLRVNLWQSALVLVLAATIVMSIQAVGVVLVSAMLIIPANIALRCTNRLERTLIISGFFGALSGLIGALLSYLFEGLSTGPSMVLVAVGCFIITAFMTRRSTQ